MSGCINRIASQINVTEDFLKGLADVLKNRAKDGVRYSKENSKTETDIVLPTLYLLLKYHTQCKTVDRKLSLTIPTGSISTAYKRTDHIQP